jgi:N-acyl-D-amino-acid deacylase
MIDNMTQTIILKNGLIINGTGNPGFYGSVLIKDKKLSVIRQHSDYIKADIEIDCSGKIISPGFIDLHSHTGLTIFGEPKHEPKVFQGVTTELIGIDGISPIPFKNKSELERYIWLDSGLNDYPPESPDWLTTIEYLNKIDNKVAINIAAIIGNGPLRIWGVGWNDKPANKKQIENMKSVLRECMEEGAWGLSTGLDYAPGAFASTDELIELGKEARKLGGLYHTHTRASLATPQNILAPFDEALEIASKSELPLHLTHYYQKMSYVHEKNIVNGKYTDYLGLIENARAKGMDVTFDCYTYPYSGTTLTIILPNWSKDGGPEVLIEHLKSTKSRQKIAKEITRSFGTTWLTNFKQPHNKKYDGLSINEIADMTSQEPTNVLFDLLVDENLGISFVGLGANPQTLHEFVKHPAGMIASDSILFGEHPSPRTFGTFTKVLSEYARDDKFLTLEKGIMKMSSFPAQRLGLKNKGLILDNYDADVIVFDLPNVHVPATKSNPRQLSEGIEQVIVNGQFVIKDSIHTGNLPGKAIRRGKDS